MTPDAAAQAVHERLEHLVTTMPEPDLEAGWAVLVAQLEPPVAPVVPLGRRPKARKAIVLGVAAAVLVAGAAFAAVRHGGTEPRSTTIGPRTPPPGRAVWGPHIHLPLSGPYVGYQPTSAHSGGGHHDVTGPSGGPTSSGDRSGSAPSGSDRHGKTHVFHHDAPDDTDHGTGNDGTHDDNGNGNNAQGQDTSGNGPSGRGSQAGPGSESHGQGSHG